MWRGKGTGGVEEEEVASNAGDVSCVGTDAVTHVSCVGTDAVTDSRTDSPSLNLA